MEKTIRVGIIGAGEIARSAHIPNYQNYGKHVEVIAVSNHNLGKAKDCREKFSIPYAYENYQDMLDEQELDAVSICTPNKFHFEQVVAALKAGCHVLCEKPPAMSVEQAEQMAEAARESRKVLTYGFHFRHAHTTDTLKRFIDGGELGNVYAVSTRWNRRRGIPGWGVFTNKELQGGGTLIDNGVHMLDTALYLMGYPEPREVLGVTYQEIGRRPGVGLYGKWDWENFSVEDMARGMITFKNGSSLMFESTFAANIGSRKDIQVSLMGDKGGADLFPLKLYQEKYDTLIDITPVYLPDEDKHRLEIHHFIKCVEGNADPVSTPEQGVILHRVMDGLYKSAHIGRSVMF